jgi:hypothetical protein
VDTSTPRSRRAILASALGGLGAVVAARLVKPEAASADPGDPVLVDGAHTGAGTTSITSDAAGAAIAGTGGGQGVLGSSVDGTGLRGESTSLEPSRYPDPGQRSGVIGLAGAQDQASVSTDETGVYGFANTSGTSAGVWGDSVDGFGIVGSSSYAAVVGFGGSFGVYGSGHVAVMGEGGATDTGVYGYVGPVAAPNPPTGVGVQATAGSISQTALNVTGKAKFSRSGRTYISSGGYARKITMSGVTTSSYVIATLQTRRTGVYVHAVVPGSGYFYIYLNKAVTATTYVGYLVIN